MIVGCSDLRSVRRATRSSNGGESCCARKMNPLHSLSRLPLCFSRFIGHRVVVFSSLASKRVSFPFSTHMTALPVRCASSSSSSSFLLGDSSWTCRRTDLNVRFLRHCEQCFRRNASFAFESTRPASGQNQHRFNAASRSTSGALERSGKAGRANSGTHSASVAEYRSSSVASKQMIASLTSAELAAALERWSTNHPLRHRLVVDELRRQHSNLTAEIRASVVERDRVKRAVQHRWLCALYARFDL